MTDHLPLSLQAQAHTIPLRCVQKLEGSERMELVTDDGRITLAIPSAMFGFLSHGDMALVTLSVWKVFIAQPEPEAAPSRLILPPSVQ